MRILQSKVKWDEGGESYRGLSIVSDTDEEEIEEDMRERCGCSHDCCGHVSQSVGRIRPLKSGRFAVTVFGWRNI